MRILLVEDDATITTAFSRYIRRNIPGAEVSIADNAATAIELLAAGGFDIVISDYNLRGQQTGADVLAWSKSHAAPLPFIFVASDDRASSLGVPYFDKPVSPATIVASIKAATTDKL